MIRLQKKWKCTRADWTPSDESTWFWVVAPTPVMAALRWVSDEVQDCPGDFAPTGDRVILVEELTGVFAHTFSMTASVTVKVEGRIAYEGSPQ